MSRAPVASPFVKPGASLGADDQGRDDGSQDFTIQLRNCPHCQPAPNVYTVP